MSDFDRFKHACWLHTEFVITRYLMSNAQGRWSGAEKAHCHMELCQFYVSVVKGHCNPETVRHNFEEEYQSVHKRTQELTDYLDEKIGFPITGTPDYQKLAPLFFEKFHSLALSALNEQSLSF